MATTALEEEKKRKALEQSGGLGVVMPNATKPSLADQIPTGGPAGWTGGNRELVQPQSDLSRNIQNTAVAMSGLPGVGPIASLAGQSGRMATGLAGLTRAGQAANAAVQTANGITSMQPSAVEEQVANAPSTAKPAPMGTSLGGSQSQRGEGSMPATPAAPATTNQGLGIVRVDAPGASPLFTNLPTNDPSNVGLMARRAAPSAQNVGAMDALAGRYEANTTAQAQAMIDAEQAAASRMTPGQAYLQQAQASMPSFKGMTRLQAATAQQQFQDMNRVRGDAARLDQDAARTRQDAGLGMFRAQDEASTNALRRKAVQADLDTKAQLDAARQEYLAAGDDPAKQKLAARKLAVLSGKDGQKEGGTWDSIVVGGGVNEQGMKVGGTAMLYNKSTGEVRPIGEQQAQAGVKPSSDGLVAGQAYPRTRNGVTANYEYLGNGQWSATPLK